MPKLNKYKRIIQKTIYLLLAVGISLLFCGCSDVSARKVILSTGFNEDEVFKIEDKSCTLSELKVYLYNLQDQYLNMYGPQLLEVEVDGEKFKDIIKNNAMADISQIKAMNIAARNEGIELSREDKEIVAKMASEYFTSLKDREIDILGVSLSSIEHMYEEYALANKYFEEVIKDINPEISDDEARTITVRHILIKTYSIDGSGKKKEYSGELKRECLKKAEEIRKMAVDGEHDFEDLVLTYSEGEKGEYSFCLGETEKSFEEAAFNLGKDEISEVVTTQYGYHIIKCISTFNREETDVNKIRIAKEQREEVFGQRYDDFASTLVTYLNEEVWTNFDCPYSEEINTSSFFEIFNKYYNNSLN